MQKNQKLTLSILALFALGSAVYFLTYKGKVVDVTPITATSTASTTVSSFTLKTESLKDSDPTYDVLIEYPQFENANHGSVEERINEQFKKEAQGIFEETSAEMKDAAVGMIGRDIITERKLNKDRAYINNETGIMSVVYEQYFDTGGAHGTFFYTTETIDLKTGEKLVLKDFLKTTSTDVVVKEIDTQVRNAATTCVRCDLLSGELENMKVEISDHFLLSDQGITFLYGSYDLGSYASTARGQEVFVDKQFLKEYISRNW